jgi:hypothetical protein
VDEHVMDRRRVLLGASAAGVVAIGGVAGASSASADGRGDSGPSGSWVISRKDDPPGDPTKVTTVLSFAGNGVIISHDLAPAGPPGTGTWERRHDNGFKGTFWFGQPGQGGPGSPGVTVRVRVRGSVRKDMISGTYVFTVFDPSGAVVTSGTGSFSGHHIDA